MSVLREAKMPRLEGCQAPCTWSLQSFGSKMYQLHFTGEATEIRRGEWLNKGHTAGEGRIRPLEAQLQQMTCWAQSKKGCGGK